MSYIMQIHKCTVFDIQKGNFPLNHDCILKVVYNPNLSLLKYDFFTCRSQDSGTLVTILKESSVISRINITTVEQFDL